MLCLYMTDVLSQFVDRWLRFMVTFYTFYFILCFVNSLVHVYENDQCQSCKSMNAYWNKQMSKSFTTFDTIIFSRHFLFDIYNRVLMV